MFPSPYHLQDPASHALSLLLLHFPHTLFLIRRFKDNSDAVCAVYRNVCNCIITLLVLSVRFKDNSDAVEDCHLFEH